MLLKILRRTTVVVVWLFLFLWTLWACGALWFDFPFAGLRPLAAGIFALLVVLLAVLLKPRWRAKLVVALANLLVMVWWLNQQPLQHRDWKPEVVVTPSASSAPPPSARRGTGACSPTA